MGVSGEMILNGFDMEAIENHPYSCHRAAACVNLSDHWAVRRPINPLILRARCFAQFVVVVRLEKSTRKMLSYFFPRCLKEGGTIE